MRESSGAAAARTAVVAAIFLAGCLGGLPAPEGLTVRTQSFDEVELTWSPACSGCALEIAWVHEGSLQLVIGGPLGPGTTSVVASFAQGAPELLQLQFRLRAVRGDEKSAWSAPVAYLRGVREPVFQAVSTVGGEAVQLSWQNQSLVASELVLERVTGGPGGVPEVTPLTTDFSASDFLDADAPELALVTYRLRYGVAGVWSLDGTTLARLPLRQPREVAAMAGPGGVTVSWTPRSAAATAQQVHCSWCLGGAAVTPDAGSFVVPGFPPWPAAVYWVEAVESSPQFQLPEDLPVATLPPFQLQDPAVTLIASAGPYPDALRPRDADGAWYDWSYQAGGTTAARHDATASTAHQLDGSRCLGLEHDGAGNPHLVTVEPAGAGAEALAHHWHDGAGWHVETSEPLPLLDHGAWFGVDAAGAVELAYLRLVEGAGLKAVHGTVSAGTFTWNELAGLDADPFDTSFAVASDGWAHVTGWSGTGPAVASRPPGGSWQVEPLPFAAHSLAPGLGGDLAIHRQEGNVGFNLKVEFSERAGGIWSPVETVGRVINGGSRVLSHHGASDRWAMTIEVPDSNPAGARSDLFLRGPDGWSQTQLTTVRAAVSPAFLPDGRLVLTGQGAVWEEP